MCNFRILANYNCTKSVLIAITFTQGSIYFAAKMPMAMAWLQLLYCATSPKLGRNEVKTKDKP